LFLLTLFPKSLTAHTNGGDMLADESARGAEDSGDAAGNAVHVALIEAMRGLYAQHGNKALSTPFLEKQRHALYPRLLAAGLKQKPLLEALGLTDEYANWRVSARTYRGVTKPKWSWETAVAKARELLARDGELPTVEECRLNGLSSLTSAVHSAGKTWEDLRIAVGLKPSTNFYPSRNGMRWLSRPEACLSDFLYARGIEHRRGERYPQDYAEQTGRNWGRYDLHFRTPDGRAIDVEVWGDSLNKLSGGRYQQTRAFKEQWQAGREDFLGVPYQQCLSDVSLTKVLEPYIGIIAPYVFDTPSDYAIQTSHWSDGGELLEECRKLAATMSDGVFPPEDWLRKRGKHKDRPGPSYNTMAIRVNQWLGGTRKVRALLGQDHASTMHWTPDTLRSAWSAFVAEQNATPTQVRGGGGKRFSPAVRALASKIDEAARRHGMLKELTGGRSARKILWTPEYTLGEWRAFTRKHGRTPSRCMSKAQRQILPRAITDEATRIYDAARRLKILDQARSSSAPPIAIPPGAHRPGIP
jgi:hypothetical protein